MCVCVWAYVGHAHGVRLLQNEYRFEFKELRMNWEELRTCFNDNRELNWVNMSLIEELE